MPVIVLNQEKVSAIREMETKRLNYLDSVKRLDNKAQAKMFNVSRRTIERIHYQGCTKGSDFPQLHITDDDIQTIILINNLKKAFNAMAKELTREKQAAELGVHKNTIERIHYGHTWAGIRRNKDASYQRVSN